MLTHLYTNGNSVEFLSQKMVLKNAIQPSVGHLRKTLESLNATPQNLAHVSKELENMSFDQILKVQCL